MTVPEVSRNLYHIQENRAFSPIPNEVILLILKNLNLKELISCSKVCKHLYQLSNTESLWKQMFLTQFPSGRLHLSQHPKSTLREIVDFHSHAMKGLYTTRRFIRPTVNMSQLSMDGHMALGTSSLRDGKVIVYDLQNNKELIFALEKEPYSVDQIHEMDEGVLAVILSNFESENEINKEILHKYKLKIIDVKKKKIIFSQDCNTVCFQKNKTFIISTQHQNEYSLEILHKTLEKTFILNTAKRIKFVSEYLDEKIVTLSIDNEIVLWDKKTGTSIGQAVQMDQSLCFKSVANKLLFYSKAQHVRAYFALNYNFMYPAYVYDPNTNTTEIVPNLEIYEKSAQSNDDPTSKEWRDHSGCLRIKKIKTRAFLGWNLKNASITTFFPKYEKFHDVAFPFPNGITLLGNSMIYRLDFRKQDNLLLDQMAKEFSKIAKIREILDLFPNDSLDLEKSDIRTIAELTTALTSHSYVDFNCDEKKIVFIEIELLKELGMSENRDRSLGLSIQTIQQKNDTLSVFCSFTVYFNTQEFPNLVDQITQIGQFEEINLDLLQRFVLLPKDTLEAIYKELPQEHFHNQKLATDTERAQAIEKYLAKNGFERAVYPPKTTETIFEVPK